MLTVRDFRVYCEYFSIQLGDFCWDYRDLEDLPFGKEVKSKKIKEVYADCGVCIVLSYDKALIKTIKSYYEEGKGAKKKRR